VNDGYQHIVELKHYYKFNY